MNRTPFLTTVAAVAVAALVACENSNITNPRTPGAATLDRSSAKTARCTITLPAPVNRPLPAVREVARELNEAFANPESSVNCGIVTGISQRFNVLVSKLDQKTGDQQLDAACGIATGLTNQNEMLVTNGQLDPIVTHPPEAGPNVAENMDFIRSEFCENAGHSGGEG